MCICAHIGAEQKQAHRLALSYFYCDPRVFQAGRKGREFLGAVREHETGRVNHPDSRGINCAWSQVSGHPTAMYTPHIEGKPGQHHWDSHTTAARLSAIVACSKATLPLLLLWCRKNYLHSTLKEHINFSSFSHKTALPLSKNITKQHYWTSCTCFLCVWCKYGCW